MCQGEQAEKSGKQAQEAGPGGRMFTAAAGRGLRGTPFLDCGPSRKYHPLGGTMAAKSIVLQGLLFAALANAYLFLIMVLTSPRVWGYADYPKAIKDKVPPQTKSEKRKALIVSLPWFVFVLGYPLVATYALKAKLGNTIAFGTAFLCLFGLFFAATLVDLVVLDWLVVSRMTPRFVIIPGSEKADYKDFAAHYLGHAKALPVMAVIAAALAAIVCWL
jgi:hypothetical protein